MLYNKLIPVLLLWLAGSVSVLAADVQETAGEKKPSVLIDRIATIINDDVITDYELNDRVSVVKQQLKIQGTPLPATDVLKKQILERMISDLLQVQFAKETGVRVDDSQLDKALHRIAQDNNLASLAEFSSKLEQEGVNFKKFREEIRNEIIFARLREREVDSKLIISDGEVDSYLATQAKQAGKSAEYQITHLLVLVPEQASADKIQARQQRAEMALAQLKGGADFAQVAAGFSDAQDAMQGGNLGWRAMDRIPAIFAEELKKMKVGDISPLLRSPNGFHIIKLLDQRSKDVPVIITQTHARHILIKSSELMPENEARDRLLEIQQRIEKGAAFDEQARLYSEDGSAAQGGDLGWISPGDTVPEFEDTMNALLEEQMSGAVQTSFGWHLIQILERRNADVSVEQKRQQARAAIRSFKSDDAYQDWLRQLRDRAYVEYRSDQLDEVLPH